MARGYPDYEGEKSKLFTVADWAAIEATDKNVSGLSAAKAWGQTHDINYTVPAGTTTYVCVVSIAAFAQLIADADLHQTVRGALYLDAIVVLELGGDGGQVISLAKPIAGTVGVVIKLRIWNYSAHSSFLSGVWNGYEL